MSQPSPETLVPFTAPLSQVSVVLLVNIRHTVSLVNRQIGVCGNEEANEKGKSRHEVFILMLSSPCNRLYLEV